MKRVGTFWICLAGGLALCAAARADDVAVADNPYAAIVTRNVFGLLPPPTNPPAQKPPDPPVKITVNGIMNIFGQAQALYKATAPGAKEQSYMLSEGQQEDDIEVIKIDEKASLVTFNNHGIVQELPLANTPASGSSGSAPGSPAPNFPNFPGRPGMGGGNPGGGFINPFTSRGGGFTGGNPGGFGGSNPNAGANSGIGFGGGTSRTYQPEEATMSPEQTQINIAANKLLLMQQGNPIYKAYPPTALDSQAGTDPGAGNTDPGAGNTDTPPQ